MLLLLGKTCAGKDTIQKELLKLGMTNVISYTTRPMRKCEKNGKEYWFISEKEFLKKQSEGFFAEVITYINSEGQTLYYGGAKKDFTNDKVMIVNLDGLSQIRQMKDINSITFYLSVSDNTIMERLKIRGDDEEMAKIRIEQDNELFKDIETKVEFVLKNDLGVPIEKMSKIIYDIYQELI